MWLGDDLVWGTRKIGSTAVLGITWSWIDLLEHLARRWVALVWEEIDPLGLGQPPWQVRTLAEQRWARVKSSEQRDLEQRALLRYEDAHNLAAALGGATAPQLWVYREGNRMVLSSGRRPIWRPVVEVLDTLAALGNVVSDRLVESKDERAQAAITAWLNRHELDPDRVVATATSLPVAKVKELRGNAEAATFWELLPQARSPSDLMVAARMLPTTTSIPVTRSILQWVRTRERQPTPDLDALAVEALAVTGETKNARPFEMGYELASWLRSIPDVVKPTGRVNPEDLLRRFGVEVEVGKLASRDIDAICCWSQTRGAAIYVNAGGRHASGRGGRRATLAHELCHLIVDRARTLPVAEVLGGRCSVFVEQRANAFAAELLLPREIAGAALGSAADPVAEVNRLKGVYGVSAEIVAWQSIRSSQKIRSTTVAYLRSLVTDKKKFAID